MAIVLVVSLILFFICFYLIGRLVGMAAARRKIDELQEAAKKIPVGINAISEKLVSPASSAYYGKKLLEAGQPRDLDVDGLMALKVVGAIIGLISAVIIGVIAGIGVWQTTIVLLILTLTGFFAPDGWLARLIEARKKELRLSLPDILDMLTISVEAGLGFDAALNKVVKNFRGALSQEFFRFLQEVQLGRSRREAWRDMAGWTNIPEINAFVLSVLQADVFGISIGKVLRVQADEMRTRRRQRAEEIAMKAPVKVVFPLVICIFPALIIVIMGPAGIRIVESLTF